MKKRKDYGLNKLVITDYPTQSITATGDKVGTPVVQIKLGKGISLTNKQLFDYLESEFPMTDSVIFTSKEDPMKYGEEIWSFIKYCNSFYKGNGYRKRWWGIVTPGTKYLAKVLYELDNILVDILPPSSNDETPPEFVSWCHEDIYIKDKIEFRIKVTSHAKDITFARTQCPLLGSTRRPITIQQTNKDQYSWKTYGHFVNEFLGTIRYPYIRLLPDMREIIKVKNIDIV